MKPKYHPDVGVAYTLAPKQGIWALLEDELFRKYTATNVSKDIVVVASFNEVKLTTWDKLPQSGWKEYNE